MKQIKVSISSLGCYEQCPRKYKYQYLDKLPRRSFEHLDVGNYVHEVLEYFHSEINVLQAPFKKEDLLKKIAKERWSGYSTKISQEGLIKSRDLLKSYLQYIDRTFMPDVLATEDEFMFNITDNIIMRGIVDRIDRMPDGSLRILDYKTGKSKNLHKFQIQVYGIHLKNKYPETEDYTGTFLVLPEGPKEVNYALKTSELQPIADSIAAQATSIMEDQTWDPKPTRLCDYCDFNNHCPDAYGKSKQNSDLVTIGKRITF